MEEKILVKELYNNDDILLSMNNIFKDKLLTSINNKVKIIISFEMVSLTQFFLKDFKNFVKDYPSIYKYVIFQKVNKHYKKHIFLEENQ